MKLKIFKLLQKNRGMTLIEVMIAAGILGGLSLVVVEITEMGQQSTSQMEKSFEISQIGMEINGYLANEQACSKTIGSGHKTTEITAPATLSLSQIKDKDGNILFEVGVNKVMSDRLNITLESVLLANYNPSTKQANFITKYKYEILGTVYNKQKTTTVSLDTTGTAINSCIANVGVALGPWVDGPSNAIYYPNGNVGIGTNDTPDYPLHINAPGVSSGLLSNSAASSINIPVDTTLSWGKYYTNPTRFGIGMLTDFQAGWKDDWIDTLHDKCFGIQSEYVYYSSGSDLFGIPFITCVDDQVSTSSINYTHFSPTREAIRHDVYVHGQMVVDSWTQNTLNTITGEDPAVNNKTFIGLNTNRYGTKKSIGFNIKEWGHTATRGVYNEDNKATGPYTVNTAQNGAAEIEVDVVTGNMNFYNYPSDIALAITQASKDNYRFASLQADKGNIGFGLKTLSAITTGVVNIALGNGALVSNTSGNRNIAIGMAAMERSTTGAHNIAIGVAALGNPNSESSENIAIGHLAMEKGSNSEYSIAIGYNALGDKGTSYNIGIGESALYSSLGSYNIAIGRNSMANKDMSLLYYSPATPSTEDLKNSTFNTAIGLHSLERNEFGEHNTALGSFAMGQYSGIKDTIADGNVAIGVNALKGFITDTKSRSYFRRNVAVGTNAAKNMWGNSNSVGANNVAVGHMALTGAGEKMTAHDNVSLGAYSLANATSAHDNIAIGSFTGSKLKYAHGNVLIGNNVAPALTSATDIGRSSHNTIIGNSAAAELMAGNRNIIFGKDAAARLTNGCDNIIIGEKAAKNLVGSTYCTSGSRNIVIGNDSYLDAGSNSNDNFLVKGKSTIPLMIGSTYKQLITASYENWLAVNYDGARGYPPKTLSTMGISFPYAFYVNGIAGGTSPWKSTSDRRYKKDINTIDHALDKLMSMRGVYYVWRKDQFPEMNFKDGRDLGFIAQEIETVLPEVVHTDDKGYKSVGYASVTPLIVEAMKEQQKMIEKLTKRIEQLEKKLEQRDR